MGETDKGFYIVEPYEKMTSYFATFSVPKSDTGKDFHHLFTIFTLFA